MLEQIIAGLIVASLIATISWIWRRFSQGGIRVETTQERGPITRELGFTESAIKITITNESEKEVRINDIRLMFCGSFGTSVAPEAPAGRFHRALPVSLASGEEENWFIPAEKLSELLRSLNHPPKLTGSVTGNLKLHARCITGSGKVCKSTSFLFSTNPDAHG